MSKKAYFYLFFFIQLALIVGSCAVSVIFNINDSFIGYFVLMFLSFLCFPFLELPKSIFPNYTKDPYLILQAPIYGPLFLVLFLPANLYSLFKYKELSIFIVSNTFIFNRSKFLSIDSFDDEL